MPVVLNHRAGDESRDLIKRLIREMYAKSPAWLEANNLCTPQADASGRDWAC